MPSVDKSADQPTAFQRNTMRMELRTEAAFDTPRALPYCIAPFVYGCRTNDGIVLLNLLRNAYVGVDPSQGHALSAFVDGWPSAELDVQNMSVVPSVEETRKVADSLTAHGLLRRDMHHEFSVPSRSVRLNGDLVAVGDEIEYEIVIRAHHIANFVLACALAKYSLLRKRLDAVAAKLYRKRVKRATSNATYDTIRTGELVCAFRRIRPYFFSADGKCLFHALAMVFFLARYNQFPAWVLGVKTKPWGAHSWVQEGNLLFDTNPEKVCDFTPILAV